MDINSGLEANTSFSIAKYSEQFTPDYYREFLYDRAGDLSSALRTGDHEQLIRELRILAGKLPVTEAFRELASLLCRRKSGALFVATAEGDIDRIDERKVDGLLDVIIQQVPMDTEQILFVHSHPALQTVLGPGIPDKIGFSDPDKGFIKHLGGKLRVFNLSDAHVSLVTANTKNVVLSKGADQGRAFGWNFPIDESR